MHWCEQGSLDVIKLETIIWGWVTITAVVAIGAGSGWSTLSHPPCTPSFPQSLFVSATYTSLLVLQSKSKHMHSNSDCD